MSSWEKNAAQEFDQWQLKGRADGMAAGHWHGTEGILQQWQFGPNSRVLDVGCGQGWLVRHICEQGVSLGVGVDVSEEMIKHAQQFSTPHSQFLVSSASNLPFENDFFSHVISIESLYYHTDPSASLLEWYRVSKAGGKIGIMVDLYQENSGSHAWVDALNIPVHLLSIEEYIEILEQAGWQNVSTQQILDPRPIKSEADFEPSAYYPSYADYKAFRAAGSLILTGDKAH